MRTLRLEQARQRRLSKLTWHETIEKQAKDNESRLLSCILTKRRAEGRWKA
jgi:hypothetical protein